MYRCELRREGHTCRFLISESTGDGWHVREERDSELLSQRHYDDWHRVERARMVFAAFAAQLRDAGWVEVA